MNLGAWDNITQYERNDVVCVCVRNSDEWLFLLHSAPRIVMECLPRYVSELSTRNGQQYGQFGIRVV
jgi:hypothetical protein